MSRAKRKEDLLLAAVERRQKFVADPAIARLQFETPFVLGAGAHHIVPFYEHLAEPRMNLGASPVRPRLVGTLSVEEHDGTPQLALGIVEPVVCFY